MREMQPTMWKAKMLCASLPRSLPPWSLSELHSPRLSGMLLWPYLHRTAMHQAGKLSPPIVCGLHAQDSCTRDTIAACLTGIYSRVRAPYQAGSDAGQTVHGACIYMLSANMYSHWSSVDQCCIHRVLLICSPVVSSQPPKCAGWCRSRGSS